jgi:hypothetical protein
MSHGEAAEVRIAGRTHALKDGATLEVQLDPTAVPPP